MTGARAVRWMAIRLLWGLSGCDSGAGSGSSPEATDLKISAAETSLAVGTTVELLATATLAAGGERDVTGEAEWGSSAPATLEVSAGRVTGVGEGTAEVTARFGDQEASFSLTVGPARLEQIEITPESPDLRRGGDQQFTYRGPALVKVFGFRQASAPYHLTLEAL